MRSSLSSSVFLFYELLWNLTFVHLSRKDPPASCLQRSCTSAQNHFSSGFRRCLLTLLLLAEINFHSNILQQYTCVEPKNGSFTPRHRAQHSPKIHVFNRRFCNLLILRLYEYFSTAFMEIWNRAVECKELNMHAMDTFLYNKNCRQTLQTGTTVLHARNLNSKVP